MGTANKEGSPRIWQEYDTSRNLNTQVGVLVSYSCYILELPYFGGPHFNPSKDLGSG